MNPHLRGPIDSTFVEDVMSKIDEMRMLMHSVVQSLHNRVSSYHYKLTGDTPESLSRLFDLDEAAMHHLLHECGLFEREIKKIPVAWRR